VEVEESFSASGGLWVDAQGLLNLARMVKHLLPNQLEEVTSHETPPCSGVSASDNSINLTLGTETSISVGTITPGAAARADHDTDCDFGKANTQPNQRTK
jgi:hypothetical protein